MLEVLNKTEILQLCFGAYILALNRCDIYVKNVLDDSSDQSLINLAAQAEAGPSEVSLPSYNSSWYTVFNTSNTYFDSSFQC